VLKSSQVKQPVRLFDFSPSCRKCKYNIRSEWNYMDRCKLFNKCVSPENQEPVVYELIHSLHCRSKEELCGVMAKYFMYADEQVEDDK
jgi:hypothetical protein